MKQHLLLGTAGHIDHGKTALVRALTGVDCDRLPDEKRREITIDLGFAPLEVGEYALGVVDVPGHERFIKNMLAGATGIDLALLAVAVDDAVKPQTREHLEILEHLKVPAGVIALTKCDLAEEEWIDLVESEVADLTAGGVLAGAPVVRVSVVSGRGLDELRAALAEASERAWRARESRRTAPLRMSVDRSFSVTGHGAVVTGSIASGAVTVGDRLVLQPSGADVRVRALQNHDRAVDYLTAGQRAAINLGGIHYDQVGRGDVLASCGLLRPSRVVTTRLTLSVDAPRLLKSRDRVRLHIGAAEITATAALLEGDQLAPGDSALTQFFLQEDAASCWGQPFVIRYETPMQLLGGGQILDPWARRLKQLGAGERELLADLGSDDESKRAAAAVYFRDCELWIASDLFALAGLPQPEPTLEALIAGGALQAVPMSSGQPWIVHQSVLSRLAAKVERYLRHEHARTPLEPAVQLSRMARYFSELSSGQFDALLTEMASRGKLRLADGVVALAEWTPRLSAKEQQWQTEMIRRFRESGLQPPSPAQLAEDLGCSAGELAPLLNLAQSQQTLTRIAADVLLHAEALQKAEEEVASALSDNRQMTVSEIRDLLQTTRKIAVPLCEHFDSVGLTMREGDVRRLCDRFSQAAAPP